MALAKELKLLEEYAKRFLFPFHRVPQGSRIVIYGAGKLGQEYARQILETGWCEIVTMIDRNWAHLGGDALSVQPMDVIDNLSFDYIVIAIRAEMYRKDIISQLMARGIPAEKILYQPHYPSVQMFHEKLETDTEAKRAYQMSQKGILFQMGEHFGDLLAQAKFIEVLTELDPGITIDITCLGGKSFLAFLLQDTPQINRIEETLPARCDLIERYACVIELIELPSVRIQHLAASQPFSPELGAALRRIQSMPLPPASAYAMIYDSIYHGETFYTKLSCRGILPWRNPLTKIPVDAEAVAAFQQMNFGVYVTMNFGNGSAADASLIAKAWPKERFECVITLMHQQFPNVRVVQLGAKQAERLEGADRYVLGQSFALVAEVLRHACLHIDIEGGLVHLATHLGTKCVVLFGPTQEAYYGYPENINIKAGDCHGCYAMYGDVNRCARDMKEPVCMYSITPEMVMEAVQRYFKEGGSGEK